MVEMEVEVTVEMVVGEMEEMGTETAEMVVEVMEMETVVLEEQKMLVLV